MPNVVQSDQFQIVENLIQRQDQALEQLNELNHNVEKAIEEINSFRIVDASEENSMNEDGQGIAPETQPFKQVA